MKYFGTRFAKTLEPHGAEPQCQVDLLCFDALSALHGGSVQGILLCCKRSCWAFTFECTFLYGYSTDCCLPYTSMAGTLPPMFHHRVHFISLCVARHQGSIVVASRSDETVPINILHAAGSAWKVQDMPCPGSHFRWHAYLLEFNVILMLI